MLRPATNGVLETTPANFHIFHILCTYPPPFQFQLIKSAPPPFPVFARRMRATPCLWQLECPGCWDLVNNLRQQFCGTGSCCNLFPEDRNCVQQSNEGW